MLWYMLPWKPFLVFHLSAYKYNNKNDRSNIPTYWEPFSSITVIVAIYRTITSCLTCIFLCWEMCTSKRGLHRDYSLGRQEHLFDGSAVVLQHQPYNSAINTQHDEFEYYCQTIVPHSNKSIH